MNIQNLEYFIVMAEEHNLTRAAERLHVSQQALSNHLQRLEDELGCRLFERRSGLELTYSGKCFLESANRMLDIHRQTLNAINDVNQNIRGELKLGISHTRGQAILPLLIPSFSRIYPEVELSIVEASTKTLEEDLDKGSIDVLIGFMPFMLENAETRELMKERLYLVVPKVLLSSLSMEDSRQPEGLATGATGGAEEAVSRVSGATSGAEEPVSRVSGATSGTEAFCEAYRAHPDIRRLASLPFVLLQHGDRIRTLVDTELHRCGITPHIALETQNVQTAVALAAEGMGVTVCPELYLKSPYTACGLPDSYIRQRVEILPFFEGETLDIIAIGYNRDRYLSRIARDFIDMSLDIFSRGPMA